MADAPLAKVKVALIGCGYVARKHAAALQRIAGAEIVGAYDSDGRSLAAFGAQQAIPVFASVEELMDVANPDMLSILTPSGVHARNILELVRYRKHLVVEKPLALKLDDIDEIFAACNTHGVKLFVVQQNRFNPPVRRLKRALEQGRFGKLVLGTVRVRWCRTQA